jgi:hypothetical protein
MINSRCRFDSDAETTGLDAEEAEADRSSLRSEVDAALLGTADPWKGSSREIASVDFGDCAELAPRFPVCSNAV